jgi:putative restriction endonuclease
MATERRYWWVNHSQTFAQEVGGNYIWSPKVEKDGKRNRSYDFMTEVKPGDVVFSYADTLIRAVGFAKTSCYFFPRPEEFGKAGKAWDEFGWRVDVQFQKLIEPISPRKRLNEIAPLLPTKYSPINNKGFGQQKIYLANISGKLAEVIAEALPMPLFQAITSASLQEDPLQLETELSGQIQWEDVEEAQIISSPIIPETTRLALVRARRGQGQFKENVFQLERACRVTRVDNPTHLIASHIKPWRVSSNEERLAGSNGLLLTPTIDHLFDRGFITFEETGALAISPVADPISLRRMGVAAGDVNVGRFNAAQKFFLEFHHKNVFLRGAS